MGKSNTEFREGQPFCPVHRFDVYKAIRASPELPPGAKVAWEALVERTWKPQTYVECSYDQIAIDIGLRRDQAKRHVAKLVRARLLRIHPRYKDKHQQSNRMEFLWRHLEMIQTGQMGTSTRRRKRLEASQ